MAEYQIWQVDAFSEKVLAGNPAAVVPLQSWLPDEKLLSIAMENNLAETAFIIAKEKGRYDLRWFTPEVEVALCGHATLATSHVLYTELGETEKEIIFNTKSGDLRVQRDGGFYHMDFPAASHDLLEGMESDVEQATGLVPVEVYKGTFIVAVFEEAAMVRHMTPDLGFIKEHFETELDEGCLLVTAPGDEGYDFVSRLFAPGIGIPEDPVTGAAHCILAPYWAKRLDKEKLKAFQASSRGGEVLCEVMGDRVLLSGKAVTYLRGTIIV